jgi:uroporphyrinogen decarboxylase
MKIPQEINYRQELDRILAHTPGRHFLLDFGGDQATVSIFAYGNVLKKLGIHRQPRINSLVQLSALPEPEFLRRYRIGFRWVYPGTSKATEAIIQRYPRVFSLDVAKEIEGGFARVLDNAFFVDEWGVTWKRAAYYFDQGHHPLEGKSYGEITRYRLPDPEDMGRVAQVGEQCARYREENPQFVIPLSQSYGGILETALWLRGYADFYMDLASDAPECSYLLDAITEYFIAFNTRYLDAARGQCDILAIGDDYGMQDRLLMAPEHWRKHIKPRYARLLACVKSRFPSIRIFHHSCGAITEILGDLIDIGVDIINPIQPLARGMDPVLLKREFGRRITFHGGIDVQRLLPFGTPDEIRGEVNRRLEVLSADGGYIIAPSHNIQAGTPEENILAFYDAVKEFQEKTYDLAEA